MKRNQFIKSIGLGAWITPAMVGRLSHDAEPPLDKALVAEFVGVAHRDKSRVELLLAENPTLLNAAHDWGRGDFETALGAASHVGYTELVTYLIERGAQTNIFTACLFGQIDIVKAILRAFPASLHAKGPHGFTTLHHAIRGGDNALELKSYLEALGAKEVKIPLY
jgi:hypothetical protein